MYPVTSESFLSEEFLKQYEGLRPKNAGVLFELIYLRTYSRFVEEWRRREYWNETIQRVVECIMSLYSGSWSREKQTRIAQELYERIFHIKLLPSGRSLWLGGTEAADRCGAGLFNCCFTTVEKLTDFYEIFYLLLCGCGVGFSVESQYISKLPKFYGSSKRLQLEEYNPIEKKYRRERTDVDYYWCNKEQSIVARIDVGDSKEGWGESILEFLKAYTRVDPIVIKMNFDSVRPKGERIKTFGGYAPGPHGLVDMFKDLHNMLSKVYDRQLTSVEVLDTVLFASKHVPSGGTRRAALIGLGDRTDNYFIDCKNLDDVPAQRAMSNNTVVYREKPNREELEKIFDRISRNGEPGFLNLDLANKKRPKALGCNPCAEILLNNKGVCNLSTVFWTSHIKQTSYGYKIDEDDLYQSVRLATFIGSCMTNVDISLPEWDKTQKSDRLLGVSFTGFMDAVEKVGLTFDSDVIVNILSMSKKIANKIADDCAFDMRIPRPLLVCTTKPEGSLSQLSNPCSSGIHRAYAPFYVRRVSYPSNDPVAKVLLDKGVRTLLNPKKPERILFEFPIKSETKISTNQESAEDQFNRYLTVMRNYTDHNTSCTLTFDPETEKEKMIDKVDEHWNELVAVSFLPKVNHGHEFAPYVEITKEEYEERKNEFPDVSDVVEKVNELVKEYYEFELEDSCQSGVCPSR